MKTISTGIKSIEKKQGQSNKLSGRKLSARAKISNGSALLPEIDGRSLWARRCRDLIEAHIDDMGGQDAISEAQRCLIRRVAVLTTEIEILESKLARSGEGGSATSLQLLQRLVNTARRTLEAIGLERRARDVTPTLEQYARKRGASQ